MTENIIEVDDLDFEARVLGSDVPVLVDFWAEWCAPCHIVAPEVEKIAREHAGKVTVAKLNVDDSPKIAGTYAVMSIPTLILFKDGKEATRLIGARGKDAILRDIDPHFAA